MNNEYEIRGDCAIIYLSHHDGTTTETVIDADDLEKVKSIDGTWFLTHKIRGYVCGRKRDDEMKWEKILLHRLIKNAKESIIFIDHINHDRMDNRKSNLREATNRENQQNRLVTLTQNESNHVNVYWRKGSKVWEVMLKVNGKRKSFGSFRDLEEAKIVANDARAKYYHFSQEALAK